MRHTHLYKRLCLSVRPSVGPSVRQQFAKINNNRQTSLLDASSHLYKRLCLSVRPSIGPSVGRSVTLLVTLLLFGLLGATYAVYPALFLMQLEKKPNCSYVHRNQMTTQVYRQSDRFPVRKALV